jgi:protein-S-isoprenylcysteine O-methyltransferase Ste14
MSTPLYLLLGFFAPSLGFLALVLVGRIVAHFRDARFEARYVRRPTSDERYAAATARRADR